MTPKHHPAQDQVQPPAEVCSSWGGAVPAGNPGRLAKGGRQQEGDRGRSQPGGRGQRVGECCLPVHFCAMLLGSPPTDPFARVQDSQPRLPLPRRRDSWLCCAVLGGQGNASHLLSPIYAKHHMCVCTLLGSPISSSSAVCPSRMPASSYQDWKPRLISLQNP